MENFVAYNPVKLYFGKGVVKNIGTEAKKIGTTALIIYGKGSVKRNGIFNDVERYLKQAGVRIIEYSGIKPNPIVEDVNIAVQLSYDNAVDMVIGVGGGSVIDTAKIVAACIPGRLSAWDVMTGKVKIEKALPVFSVLTLVATGTEMNPYAVIQNNQEREKIGFGHNLFFPKCSFLDPEYTFTVDAQQTAYGLVDLIAHALENYFGKGDAPLADKFVISIVKEAILISKELITNLNDYELRARMMWASSNALNGNTSYGRASGDFAVHAFGHTLSLLYDLPHAASLSVVYPAWLKYLEELVPAKLKILGSELFGCEDTKGFIEGLTNLFTTLNCPVSLPDAGIDISKREEIKNLWIEKKVRGYSFPVSPDVYDFLLDKMFQE